ncbi:MAG: hypothetical protein IPG45_15885 [Deltaproteobacteria bacterium]|nr:hypothetical protein [Deltaproteobacteria bacterium]
MRSGLTNWPDASGRPDGSDRALDPLRADGSRGAFGAGGTNQALGAGRSGRPDCRLGHEVGIRFERTGDRLLELGDGANGGGIGRGTHRSLFTLEEHNVRFGSAELTFDSEGVLAGSGDGEVDAASHHQALIVALDDLKRDPGAVFAADQVDLRRPAEVAAVDHKAVSHPARLGLYGDPVDRRGRGA